MPQFYFTAEPTANPVLGHAYIRGNGSPALTALTIPTGASALDRKPDLLRYRKRTYNIGQFNRLLVRDEYGKLRLGGVRPPRTVPAMANGSFTGGVAGEIFIGYQTFVVKQGNVKIAESNPGSATASLTSTGTGRAWTNLDTSPEDAHVTHTRLYVSVDGEVPALAQEIPLPFGGSSAENTLSAALGETLPVRTAPDGTVTLNPYARGVPPYCKFAEVYHDAMFYAGDPNHPERIYYSRLFEPEGVNSTPIIVNGRTEEPWLNTTDGEPVTGIRRQGDELVVGTLRAIDIIQGYSGTDYTIHRASNYWGVVSHFSMRRCGPLGSLFFASPQGVSMYNAGAFRYISGPIENWWLTNFDLYPSIFENAYGVEDRANRNYRLLLPQYQGYSLYLNCNYFGAEQGEPVWVTDKRNRDDEAMAELISDNSRLQYNLYTGSCDGYVRQENVQSDGSDDGDTYKKKFVVRTPHRFPAGQEGDDTHGNTYTDVNVFLKHDQQDATLKMWAGDDDAPSAAQAQWTPIAEGPLSGSPATAAPAGDRPITKKTSEHHPLRDLSGKGVTLQIEVDLAVDVEYRGMSVDFIEGGEQQRPFTT